MAGNGPRKSNRRRKSQATETPLFPSSTRNHDEGQHTTDINGDSILNRKGGRHTPVKTKAPTVPENSTGQSNRRAEKNTENKFVVQGYDEQERDSAPVPSKGVDDNDDDNLTSLPNHDSLDMGSQRAVTDVDHRKSLLSAHTTGVGRSTGGSKQMLGQHKDDDGSESSIEKQLRQRRKRRKTVNEDDGMHTNDTTKDHSNDRKVQANYLRGGPRREDEVNNEDGPEESDNEEEDENYNSRQQDQSVLNEMYVSSTPASSLQPKMNGYPITPTLFRREMQCFRNEVIVEVRAMEKRMRDFFPNTEQDIAQLRADLNEVKSLCCVSDILKRIVRSDKQRDLDASLPLFDLAFNNLCLTRVFDRCVLRHILSYISKNLDDFSMCAVASIRVMMWSVLANQSRDHYETEIGAAYSSFRSSLVKTAIRSAQQNAFNVFSSEDEVFTHATKATNSNSEQDAEVKVVHPTWLRPGFIGMRHIETARLKVEETASKRKGKGNGNSLRQEECSTKDQIAAHGCGRVYATIVAKLHDSRESAKAVFFEKFGFLFSHWSHHDALVDQSSMSLQWACADSTRLSKIPAAIPHMTTRHPSSLLNNGSSSAVAAVDESNMRKLNDVIQKYPEFILIIRHNVKVEKLLQDSGPGNKIHQRSRKTKDSTSYDDEEITRNINLLNVASCFLASFTRGAQFSTPKNLLAVDRESCKVVFAVASILRQLCEVCIKGMEEQGVIEFVKNYQEGMEINGLDVHDLMPSYSRMCVVLKKKLFLTKRQFQQLNRYYHPLDKSTRTDDVPATEIRDRNGINGSDDEDGIGIDNDGGVHEV